MTIAKWEFYCLAHDIKPGSWCIFTPTTEWGKKSRSRALLQYVGYQASNYYHGEIGLIIFHDPTVSFADIRMSYFIQEFEAGAFEF